MSIFVKLGRQQSVVSSYGWLHIIDAGPPIVLRVEDCLIQSNVPSVISMMRPSTYPCHLCLRKAVLVPPPPTGRTSYPSSTTLRSLLWYMVGEDKYCCQGRGKERLKFINNRRGLDNLEPQQSLCVWWHHAQHCWCLGRCRRGASALVFGGSPGAVFADRPTPCRLIVWTVFRVVFVLITQAWM